MAESLALGKKVKNERRKRDLLDKILLKIADKIDSGVDQFGRIRYGVPTSEKERLARMGALPGSPSPDTADAEEADRYASGYLFAKTNPRVSKVAQPWVSNLKVARFGKYNPLSLFGGSSPELQSFADAGSNAGRLAALTDEDSDS